MADLTDIFSGNGDRSVKVAVYAALMYDIISATNSSPQTTEINASKRAATLMKWVHMGLVQGLFFVALGMYLDKDRWPPLMGGGLAAVLLYGQYLYALKSGTQNPGESTENVR